MKNHLLRILVILGSLLPFCASSEAQYFVNGDFETGTTGSVGSSSTAVTGWTTTVGGGTGAGVYHSNNTLEGWVPTAQHGSYCLQLDGSSPNNDQAFLSGAQTTVSQIFKVSAAGTYTFSFFMSGEAGTSKAGTVGVLVSLTGTGISIGALNNMEYTVNNTGATAGSWTQETATFTVADPGQSITLTFTDDNTHTGSAGAYTSTLANYTKSSNVAIDNVSVVPEPSSWTLLGIGAVGAGVVALRRPARS